MTARSERLMLETYNIHLPTVPSHNDTLPGKVDSISVKILEMYQEMMNDKYTPLYVAGDGNCLYRAISLGLLRDVSHHIHLRLLTALELAENRASYDIQHPDYQGNIDDEAVQEEYNKLLYLACKLREWSAMGHIYAISAVTKTAVGSYHPPALLAYYETAALCRKVCGRGVSRSGFPPVTVMWTRSSVPQKDKYFRSDHFVPLFKKPQHEPLVDLTGDKTSPKTNLRADKLSMPQVLTISDFEPENNNDMSPTTNQRKNSDGNNDDLTRPRSPSAWKVVKPRKSRARRRMSQNSPGEVLSNALILTNSPPKKSPVDTTDCLRDISSDLSPTRSSSPSPPPKHTQLPSKNRKQSSSKKSPLDTPGCLRDNSSKLSPTQSPSPPPKRTQSSKKLPVDTADCLLDSSGDLSCTGSPSPPPLRQRLQMKSKTVQASDESPSSVSSASSLPEMKSVGLFENFPSIPDSQSEISHSPSGSPLNKIVPIYSISDSEVDNKPLHASTPEPRYKLPTPPVSLWNAAGGFFPSDTASGSETSVISPQPKRHVGSQGSSAVSNTPSIIGSDKQSELEITSSRIRVNTPDLSNEVHSPDSSHDQDTPDLSNEAHSPVSSYDQDTPVIAEGGHDLPYPGKFLELRELLVAFRVPDLLDSTLPKRIPMGLKEDKYYFFDNSANIKRRENKLKSQLWDDCGVWIRRSSSTTYLIVDSDGKSQTELYKKNGIFGTNQRKMVNGKRVGTFVALEPQPPEDEVVIIHRTYGSLQLDTNYRRRISWLGNIGEGWPTVAVAEYAGKFPGRVPHGNQKNHRDRAGEGYIRTHPDVLDKIKKNTRHEMPAKILRNMVLETDDIMSQPRNRKQIANIRDKQKQHENPGQSSTNFANQIQTVEDMLMTHDFVQLVIKSTSKVPSVILHTEQQINDLKRFCCPIPGAQKTFLGFDRTFNLTDVWVTSGVYKNLSVLRRTTNDHPIFLGPVLLHGSAGFPTYHQFFSHLAGEVCDGKSQPIIGSDDEKAMKKAYKLAFPSANTLNCTQHLKKNFLAHLTNKIGVNERDRNKLIGLIFGPDGVVSCDDEIIFEHKIEKAKREFMKIAPSHEEYFMTHIENMLVENWTTQENEKCGHLLNWTNNNCESMNNIFKNITNRRHLKLPEIVLQLGKLIQFQYKQLQRAILGEGEFMLHESYKKFYCPIEKWCKMTQESRERHFKNFLNFTPGIIGKNLITSRDGMCTVVQPKNGGKKPGQRKRKASDRTTSIKKRKTNSHPAFDILEDLFED